MDVVLLGSSFLGHPLEEGPSQHSFGVDLSPIAQIIGFNLH